MLVLSCTAVIGCFCVLCTVYFSLYFSLFSCHLDLLLCVFSNSASGLQTGQPIICPCLKDQNKRTTTRHGELGLSLAALSGRSAYDTDIATLVSTFNTSHHHQVSTGRNALGQCSSVRSHPTNVRAVASVAIDNASEGDVTADGCCVSVWINVRAQLATTFQSRNKQIFTEKKITTSSSILHYRTK